MKYARRSHEFLLLLCLLVLYVNTQKKKKKKKELLFNSFDVEEKPPIKIFVAVQATHDVISGKKAKEREKKRAK
jgi:hypothetical protein